MVLVGLAIATGWFLLIVPGGYLRHGPPYCEKPLGPPLTFGAPLPRLP